MFDNIESVLSINWKLFFPFSPRVSSWGLFLLWFCCYSGSMIIQLHSCWTAFYVLCWEGSDRAVSAFYAFWLTSKACAVIFVDFFFLSTPGFSLRSTSYSHSFQDPLGSCAFCVGKILLWEASVKCHTHHRLPLNNGDTSN